MLLKWGFYEENGNSLLKVTGAVTQYGIESKSLKYTSFYAIIVYFGSFSIHKHTAMISIF